MFPGSGNHQPPTTTLYDHHMPPATVLLIYLLAVARLTTIITTDEITHPLRQALINHLNPVNRLHRWAVYAIGGADDNANGCPWCVSVWVGSVTAPLVWAWPTSPILLVPMLALAASQVAGMTSEIGR
jgi:hypothetical protein